MEQNEQIGKKRKIEEIVGNKVKRVKQEGKWGRRGKKRENKVLARPIATVPKRGGGSAGKIS